MAGLTLKNIYKKYPSIVNVDFDALLAGYLCNPSASSYSLDRLSQEYGASLPEIIGETDDITQNACLFADTCKKLYKELEKSEQLKLLKEIEIPLAKVLGDMELKGFLVDVDGLKAMSDELAERIAELFDLVKTLFQF